MDVVDLREWMRTRKDREPPVDVRVLLDENVRLREQGYAFQAEIERLRAELMTAEAEFHDESREWRRRVDLAEMLRDRIRQTVWDASRPGERVVYYE